MAQASTPATHTQPTRRMTLPNHFWCVGCSRQHPIEQKIRCIRPRCNASYCHRCVSNYHAAYFQIITQSGDIPPLTRARCRYCGALHHLEFFKSAKILPITVDNVEDLATLREDVRTNILRNQIEIYQTHSTEDEIDNV